MLCQAVSRLCRFLANALVAAGSCWCNAYGLGPPTVWTSDEVTTEAARGVREIEAYLARLADAA
jgi:hypothetical protein